MNTEYIKRIIAIYEDTGDDFILYKSKDESLNNLLKPELFENTQEQLSEFMEEIAGLLMGDIEGERGITLEYPVWAFLEDNNSCSLGTIEDFLVFEDEQLENPILICRIIPNILDNNKN